MPRGRTVFKGVVLWEVEEVCILHAEQVIDLWVSDKIGGR